MTQIGLERELELKEIICYWIMIRLPDVSYELRIIEINVSYKRYVLRLFK